MKIYFYVLVAFLLMIPMSCGTDSPTSPRVFTDALALGKGIHGIDLTGETYAFTITHTQEQDIFPTIYWRAESQSKMAGVFVEMKIERLAEVLPEVVYFIRYELIQKDDNVAISSYFHMYGAGNFRATATIGPDKRLLGVKEFNVQ